MADAWIFISYRREDSRAIAHRLADDLREHFGDGQVFIDRDLAIGARVDADLIKRVEAAGVVIVVVGPSWLKVDDKLGRRRLEDATDLLRGEIATAFDSRAPDNRPTQIIPVLVNDAAAPTKEQLAFAPELQPFAGLNAFALHDDWRWGGEVRALIAQIHPPPSPEGKGRWLAAGAVAVLVVAAIVAAVLLLGGSEPVVVYSSLPQREQQLPAARTGAPDDPTVVANKDVADMEKAIRLALDEAGGKAGDDEVVYKALDASDDAGASSIARVQANAKRAADDENTGAYIGDYTSGATQESIPILSRARVAQIGPSSTRVGLTTEDRRGEVDEPARYYPAQAGYPEGYLNFVRVIPRDTVQARALLALMAQKDRCGTVVMINDNSAYGEALANNILAYNRKRVHFRFSQSVGPYGRYDHLVERTRKLSPDCFVYAGARNPNTVQLVQAFADAVPSMGIYGTDGIAVASFYDPADRGLAPEYADRVQLMVPPRGTTGYDRFVAAFDREYGDANPSPYAAYAYEAMRLALVAIDRAGSRDRQDIVEAMFDSAGRTGSAIGDYAITARGDTTVATYGVSRIEGGELTPPQAAPRLRRR